MDYEKMIDQEMKKNPEMKEVLEDPKKKKAYEEKLADTWGARMGASKKPVVRPCDTCQFAHGDNPFENKPTKAYCQMYPKKDGIGKPNEVYMKGGRCLYYVREKENE